MRLSTPLSPASLASDYLRILFNAVNQLRSSNTFRFNLLAGITVSLVAIPQALAYAQLAGVPAYYGLYASLLPTIIGALFGSSQLLSTGPVAMTSLLTAASVAPLAAAGSETFYSYVILLALISGLFQIAFGVLRIGVILNFLSNPVLMGFINAAAIIIGLSQLPALLGIPVTNSQHFLMDVGHVVVSVSSTHMPSLIFGMLAISLLLAFKRYLPKLPGVLITVAVLTVASYVFHYADLGGKVIGDIPRGFPEFSVPPLDWNATMALLPAGFVIALISFMEAMSSSKIIAIKTRQPWNENKELIGQGLAKIAAAFSQSMPVSGSFSRSALNLASGAKTRWSSIISASFVMITLLFLTPLLYHLPKPVLSAIIMAAVFSLINFRTLTNAWRAKRDDGIAAAVTFVATLSFAPNIQNGILTGIILSLALLLYRMMKPRIALLGLHSDNTLRDSERHGLPAMHPSLGALRFDGALRFVNVAYFEDALLKVERDNPKISHILIKASGINDIDASGIEMLLNMFNRFKNNDITLVFSGIKKQVIEVMDRTGLTAAIGQENIFNTDQEALNAIWGSLPQAEEPLAAAS